jgi:heme-degrading monooxygenase HmoA
MRGMYTLGDWHIKEGREDAFVEAWTDLAQWSIDDVDGSSFAKVLRDTADPQRFITFGPWRDADAVAAWQAHPGFQERVAHLRELAESFQPRMLTVEGEVGATTPNPW